ncbi:MAG: type I 3-dehydroquinate dehydratase [Thermoproteota archaeon]
MNKICVSFPPKDVEETLNLIRKAEKNRADFIEVRLDSLDQHRELEEITNSTDIPLIATNRSTKCQGHFTGSEEERKKILLDAAKKGFDYVDLELSTQGLKDMVTNLRKTEAKPIISFHNFDATPPLSRLKEVLQKQMDSGAHICKIVTTAKSLEDNLKILDFVSQASKKAKVICFCMGNLGKPSRLLSPIFGAFFTIASLDSARKTASGQLTFQQMKTIYNTLEMK